MFTFRTGTGQYWDKKKVGILAPSYKSECLIFIFKSWFWFVKTRLSKYKISQKGFGPEKEVRKNCILNQSWEHSRLRFSRVSQLKFEANRSKDSWSDKQIYRDCVYILYIILLCTWTRCTTVPFKHLTDQEWRYTLTFLSTDAHLIVEHYLTNCFMRHPRHWVNTVQ